MNKTVYSQLDTRWSGLPYPNKTYTIGNSGCGCVSVTHLLIETDKYKKLTPKDVQPYMKQFATYGNGTTWAGLTASLKHYGFGVKIPAKMSEAFATLNNVKYKMGLLSMRGGSRGGITYTLKGHIMSFVDYKYDAKKKRHYFYLKDSGGRKNTGWFCYETQMKGLIANIWIATPPASLFTTQTYTIKFGAHGGEGEMKSVKVAVGQSVALPTNKFKRNGFKFVGWAIGKESAKKVNMKRFQLGHIDCKNKAKVKDLAKANKSVTLYAVWKGYSAEAACLWARKIAADNKFMYGEDNHKNWANGRDRAHQIGCHFCGTTVSGPKKAKKGSKWDFTYCCNSFVFASYCHGANLFTKCKGGSTNPEFWLKLKKGGKPLFKKIGKNVAYKDLKPGTILMNGKHIVLYVGEIKGNPCICHAAGEGWTNKSIRTQKVSGKSGNYVALKYVGR